MVWSPPRVMTRGRVLPFLAGPLALASVAGARVRIELWPSSIWCRAHELSYLWHHQLGTCLGMEATRLR